MTNSIGDPGRARDGTASRARLRECGLPTPYAERVLDVVAAIPTGRVRTYGDVAALVGAGTGRHVGAVLAQFGDGVPWHRVVRSDGRPAAVAVDEAVGLLAAESVAWRAPGVVDLSLARLPIG